ncbi:hypothetical protein D3C73_1638140 [compost metagenome]
MSKYRFVSTNSTFKSWRGVVLTTDQSEKGSRDATVIPAPFCSTTKSRDASSLGRSGSTGAGSVSDETT